LGSERPAKVLVADDNTDLAESIKLLLESEGYEVVGIAPDGLEAVALTQSLEPDAVVMDVRMADMDGIEAARLIHQACPTPVVILTAHDTPELLRQASSAGVGMYLVKPTNGPELDRAISIAMARFGDMMELRRLNDELESRNSDLDTFAYSVAHDLKNPLHFIINYALLLREDWREIPPEDVEDRLRIIQDNATRMSNIIDELLLLAQTRQDDVPIEKLDMASIVAEVQTRLSFMIEQHNAEISVASVWPEAQGYGPWVLEVWANYLSNAIKYGGVPPRVELGADVQSDGMVTFWTQDHGPGIPEEDQTRLFTPFTRLDQVSTKGHGLGLSIVRGIVGKLGGEVGVTSVVGEGSTFSFTLPAPPT
jgi:signal transduction histidine kinase